MLLFAEFTARIIVACIGLIIGLVMGLTGAGGGILAVPALVYSQGWSMQQAMPVALLAVTSGAMIGSLEGFSKGLVRYRAAIVMALAGAVPTWLGVQLAHRLSQTWLMGMFALVLLLAAARLAVQLKQDETCEDNKTALARINQQTGRFDWTPRTGALIASIGSVAGLMTGLLGVGGGFIIVPMLRQFTNLSMHGAVATSLFFISLVGSMGVGSALLHGVRLPLVLSAVFVAATIAGMMAARRLISHLPPRIVQQAFIALLCCVAFSLLWRATH
ncbi:sulfite exporter TauE/SafE family protein [Undibacterium rugosum]|uniref:sulfite exporter TauE/SafE family protein n=1 Tax=Undibacterium rugosum TaxID=2762291 RepID=UPI0022A892E5|nr:sulfite exporter TauE/SafE family protein [Undibacterium rugosum]